MTELEKNIKLVQDMFSAYDKRDLKTIIDNLGEKVDWQCPVTGDHTVITWAKPRRDKHEVESFFKEYLDAVSSSEMKPLHFGGYGDRVFVEGTERSTIKSTGAEYQVDWVMVLVIKNGKATSVHEYCDTVEMSRALRGEARKAA